MAGLCVVSIGPGATVQDMGRPGWLAQGLSTGGAADPLALLEAAALLTSDPQNAVIEMMGMGGTFRSDTAVRFTLTGAEVPADIDGAPIATNTSNLLPAGATLTIGPARKGVYSYLAFAGGVQTPQIMESRATHLTAAIGRRLQAGDRLPLGPDPDRTHAPQKLVVPNRLEGGTLRIMPGPQTDLFDDAVIRRFTNTPFRRNPRGNRQGIRLDYEGDAFATRDALNLVSDLITPGDVQITGDGVPYILLAECQTIGGYPRLGTVIPADLPIVAQAAPGTVLRFAMVPVEEADATATTTAVALQKLRKACQPSRRDPHDIADLLRYQLISGATRGDDLERQTDDAQD